MGSIFIYVILTLIISLTGISALKAQSMDGGIGIWSEYRGGGDSGSSSGSSSGSKLSSRLNISDDTAWRACISEILAAEKRHGIPNNYLLAISLTESGKQLENGTVSPWPWTVNAEGEGRYFENREDAISWVRENQDNNKESIDIGCMQVNLRWHPNAFESVEQGFIPSINIDYASKLLKSLKENHGTWNEAVARYHSHTPNLGASYRSKVMANLEYVGAARQLAESSGKYNAPPTQMETDHLSSTGEGNLFGVSEGAALSWVSGGLYADGAFKPLMPSFASNAAIESE